MDWKATLINLLKSQPGSNGGPLKRCHHIKRCRYRPNQHDFFYDYVDRTPLTGIYFNANAYEVHSYIVLLISENLVSEQKLITHKDSDYGRVDYFSLKELYEVVGAKAKSFLAAGKTFKSFSTEVKIHLTCGGTNSKSSWPNFLVIDNNTGCKIHTDVMKLRMLNSKIRADFPVVMKTNIYIQINMQPIVMKYTSTLSN